MLHVDMLELATSVDEEGTWYIASVEELWKVKDGDAIDGQVLKVGDVQCYLYKIGLY